MKKYIINLLKFSVVLLILPISILIIDPYNHYAHPFKLDMDRMALFRSDNVANWALVEISKIDDDLKSSIKTCVIGDSRSRLIVSHGHQGGWTQRVCGTNLDVLDLSFGGANLDESFTVLNNEMDKLEALETVIVSVAVDRLLLQNHEVNRISASYLNSYTSELEYLTNRTLVSHMIDNKDKIMESRDKIHNDTVKLNALRSLGSIQEQNDQIRANRIDSIQIKKRHRNIEFRKERFEKTIKHRDRNAGIDENRAKRDEKIRKSFLRQYEKANRELFDKNLKLFKAQLAEVAKKYEVVLMIPTYDDILFEAVMEQHGEDYKYYVEAIKNLPYEVFNLQERSNEFVFVDPVHGNYENGVFIHKINHERASLMK